MSGHIGLREEARAGRLLALQIAHLFTSARDCAQSRAVRGAYRLSQPDGGKPLGHTGRGRSL